MAATSPPAVHLCLPCLQLDPAYSSLHSLQSHPIHAVYASSIDHTRWCSHASHASSKDTRWCSDASHASSIDHRRWCSHASHASSKDTRWCSHASSKVTHHSIVTHRCTHRCTHPSILPLQLVF